MAGLCEKLEVDTMTLPFTGAARILLMPTHMHVRLSFHLFDSDSLHKPYTS